MIPENIHLATTGLQSCNGKITDFMEKFNIFSYRLWKTDSHIYRYVNFYSHISLSNCHFFSRTVLNPSELFLNPSEWCVKYSVFFCLSSMDIDK